MNAYLKSLLVFISFILYNETCKLITEYLIINKYIYLNQNYIYVIDIIINIPLLLILYFLIRKNNHSFFLENKKNKSLLIYTILLCLAFKIGTIPIMHLEFILGEKKIGAPLPSFSPIFILLSFVSMVILIPLVEEIIFRKVILSFFGKKQLMKGILFSSFLFLLAHYGYKRHINIQIINILFLGLITGTLYTKYGFLYNYVFHMAYNLFWYILNFNRKEYSDLLSYLNFDYRYWLIVIMGIAVFFYLTVKLKLLPQKSSYQLHN
ncbi:CPBP family intramembrane glutamic endopeptidase [Elizabethkingia meningoseptica]|uniref:CPBP family intramembrane glutamic endopeptidase n=1 Tax=Elizabethkingia meningoseptica TaxID=238 RepID=UPI0023B1CFC0|nr:CPBP family intramembrane glutamic endopeptidase [Elizabethkingia meningoseptica]MDE5432395.1 CPBP family intramembrane metalloprotease [Elizabethkingia meningoseptica]